MPHWTTQFLYSCTPIVYIVKKNYSYNALYPNKIYEVMTKISLFNNIKIIYFFLKNITYWSIYINLVALSVYNWLLVKL